MGLTASNQGGGKDFAPCPEGMHHAVCVAVIDIGTHINNFGNEQQKMVLMWEIPALPNPDNDNKPFTVSKRYTNSLSEKAHLLKDLTTWRGTAFTAEQMAKFDVSKVLGQPCMLQIMHSPPQDGRKTYANVNAVMQLPPGTHPPSATIPSVMFDIDNPDMNIYNNLSKGMQNTIMRSENAVRANDPKCELTPFPPAAAAAGSGTGQYAAAVGQPPQGNHQAITEDDIPF